jgi:hypothetical protein
VKLITMTLIDRTPDPVTGVLKLPTERLAAVVDNGALATAPATAFAPGKES